MEWARFRSFLAGNGAKQGGVLSHVLFCLYIDGLLVALPGLALAASWAVISLVR